jgi:putative Mn2+ efflux pump MntP
VGFCRLGELKEVIVMVAVFVGSTILIFLGLDLVYEFAKKRKAAT